MRAENTPHNFHIPVMGIGYTIDTPMRVAPYGINSVVSIMDDIFIEKMTAVLSRDFNKEYVPIDTDVDHWRSKKITAYLNLLQDIVTEKFKALQNSQFHEESEITKYFELLPDTSHIKQQYQQMITTKEPEKRNELQKYLKTQISPGAIDVNILTKADRVYYKNGKALPSEYNNAHAALKGYANSKLESSLVLSAGMNPRLYDYASQFEDFYPDKTGYIRKKIILKVSDIRSARIQGKFLAKKGLWVSEYRIESGLNCGGHAFATDGFLLGPILEEFKTQREELINENFEIYKRSLSTKGHPIPKQKPKVNFSAQGGVGTAKEHAFLLEYYKLKSIGWGSPFLLVPEATNLDKETLELLQKAEEKSIYLSNISPLGIPFNNLRENTKDKEKEERIRKNKPGSPCIQQFMVSNTTYTKKPVCTASRKYQNLAIKDLKTQNLSQEDYQNKYLEIVEKSCICVGLSTSALKSNHLDTSLGGDGVSVCPGPNLAYFSNTPTLKEMIDHIYGRNSVLKRVDRPNIFIKEFDLYLQYLKDKISEKTQLSEKQSEYFETFKTNLHNGIRYYTKLFQSVKLPFNNYTNEIIAELKKKVLELDQMKMTAPC